MHNFWIRLNAVTFFALTVLLALATLCALSTYLHVGDPKVKAIRSAPVHQLTTYRGNDRALFDITLSADLRPTWHWNIHQLFVFLVAEYKTDDRPLNQIIIWDKIITNIDDAMIRTKKNEKLEYHLTSQGQNLRDREVTLKLMWDHMPVTGRLYASQDDRKTFTFTTPSNITTAGRKRR